MSLFFLLLDAGCPWTLTVGDQISETYRRYGITAATKDVIVVKVVFSATQPAQSGEAVPSEAVLSEANLSRKAVLSR